MHVNIYSNITITSTEKRWWAILSTFISEKVLQGLKNAKTHVFGDKELGSFSIDIDDAVVVFGQEAGFPQKA